MRIAIAVVAGLLCGGIGQADSLKTKTTETMNKTATRRLKTTTTFRNGVKILEHVETGPATNQITELIIETVFYQDRKLIVEIVTPPKGARKGHTERMFYATSGAGVGEMDNDSDGRFDLLTVMTPEGTIYEAFNRSKDKWLTPISDGELKRTKQLSTNVEHWMNDLTTSDSPPEKSKRRK